LVVRVVQSRKSQRTRVECIAFGQLATTLFLNTQVINTTDPDASAKFFSVGGQTRRGLLMTIASDRIESFLVRHRGETISRSEKVIVSQFGIRRLTETERCGDQPLMVDQKRHRDPHPCQGALNKVRREAKCLGMRDALFKLGDAPSTLRNMAVHQVQVCVGVGHCSNAEGYGQRTERQIHVDRTDCSRNRDNGYDTYPSRTLVLVQHAGALRDVALNLHSNRGQGAV
jgi:hypothetical protein